MIRRICVILLVLSPQLAAAQDTDPWIRFFRKNTQQAGFRDRSGTIRIPPDASRYGADTFHNIMSVEDSSYHTFFLLKDGRRIGRDSVHYFDATPDCESEGRIRFRDRQHDLVGFFDTAGQVAIPALYNYASPFRNGLSVAYRNGRKRCADRDTVHCEHWTWVDGETVLINERNEVLSTGLDLNGLEPDWYSMQRNLAHPDTGRWISIRGVDGTTYSFADKTRDFRYWLQHEFRPALGSDTALRKHLFPVVIYSNAKGRRPLSPRRFLRKIGTGQIAALLRDDSLQTLDVFRDSWFMISSANARYRPYLSSCGVHDEDRYPSFDVVVSYHKAGGDSAATGLAGQRSLQFLRTAAGYKLVGLAF